MIYSRVLRTNWGETPRRQLLHILLDNILFDKTLNLIDST